MTHQVLRTVMHHTESLTQCIPVLGCMLEVGGTIRHDPSAPHSHPPDGLICLNQRSELSSNRRIYYSGQRCEMYMYSMAHELKYTLLL